jgi:dimeric dUTPase (all-alpha-NTP-PPase superfamily)
MNWEKLFRMQDELDQRIRKEHQLESAYLVDEKILALLVEIGELANETRCFKYWSNKGASPQDVILEEYVDGLHFIISIGIELGFSYEKKWDKTEPKSLTEQFIKVYNQISDFAKDCSRDQYELLVDHFLSLGYALGFTGEDIEKAYENKNEINHVRQEEGY